MEFPKVLGINGLNKQRNPNLYNGYLGHICFDACTIASCVFLSQWNKFKDSMGKKYLSHLKVVRRNDRKSNRKGSYTKSYIVLIIRIEVFRVDCDVRSSYMLQLNVNDIE